MRFFLVAAGFSLLLASCASNYKNPKGDLSSLAVIKNHDKGHIWDPTVFSDDEKVMVYTIDGKKVSYDWTWRVGTKTILVKPGAQDLEIIVAARKKTVYRQKVVRVQFVAEAGKAYALKGTYSGPDAKFWIEEAGSKKAVSPVRSVEMNAVLPGSQAPMIIFLPAG